MAAAPSHMWYVRAAGAAWGPYPETRVAGFVAEGRVRADTPVSPWADGPFGPAGACAEFAPLFETPPPAPVVAPAPTAAPSLTPLPAQPTTGASASAPSAAPAFTAAPRPLLIWAEFEPARQEALHHALAELGPGVTLGRSLWLVQARAGASAVRNHLSRRLGPADRLLVLEASLEQAAWFNLARDHDLRRLWASGPQSDKRSGAA